MRKLFLVLFVLSSLTFLNSCTSGSNGQLTGVLDRPTWRAVNPYGMAYVPSGTFHIGNSDQDISFSYQQRAKAVSIQGFYMDDTEITNNEYRQFVNWVKDSIAHGLLDHYYEDDDGNQFIDWTYEIFWDDPEEQTELRSMYFNESEQFWGQKQLNAEKYVFDYDWYDWAEAGKKTNRGKNRSDFIRNEKVQIYPDTLVWIGDFSYSYNEPMTRNYFWHPAFDDYPVVGLKWDQANAFAAWRTKFWNDYRSANGEIINEDFRLPFEHEWEYAARGGLEQSPYPWGGPYMRNKKGCVLANFKPGRGNYPEDGGFYTVRADAYNPNDFGLYNMSGNVSEWTSSAYFKNAYSFQHDMNPNIRFDADEEDSETMKRKVVRGGSWKDVAYYLQTGTRHYEYSDSAKSYVGFRCSLTFLGRSQSDFQ